MNAGIITRVTHNVPQVPSAIQRLAQWFENSALLRAGASLGNDEAMDSAPNILPMRRPSRIEAVVNSICTHCRDHGYSKGIERTAAQFAVMCLRGGASGSSAAYSGKLRADHLRDVYGPDWDAA